MNVSLVLLDFTASLVSRNQLSVRRARIALLVPDGLTIAPVATLAERRRRILSQSAFNVPLVIIVRLARHFHSHAPLALTRMQLERVGRGIVRRVSLDGRARPHLQSIRPLSAILVIIVPQVRGLRNKSHVPQELTIIFLERPQLMLALLVWLVSLVRLGQVEKMCNPFLVHLDTTVPRKLNLKISFPVLRARILRPRIWLPQVTALFVQLARTASLVQHRRRDFVLRDISARQVQRLHNKLRVLLVHFQGHLETPAFKIVKNAFRGLTVHPARSHPPVVRQVIFPANLEICSRQTVIVVRLAFAAQRWG